VSEIPVGGMGAGPGAETSTGPVLVGGIGHPWLRDLDFGTQFLRRVQDCGWPEGVVLEDLSYSAHRVLHTLQERHPSKVLLVCCVLRETDPPGTIRRYVLDLTPPPDDEVAERLGEAVGGVIDLDHTLAVVRYWKGFPPDTIVIEIEPGDVSFGLGFSDPVEAVVDEVLAAVREELGIDSRGLGLKPAQATLGPL
jgi:hydrogenase maturation protease